MRKAGGFIAIIAGVFGSCDPLSWPILSMIFALAYNSKITIEDLLFRMGYLGVLFSFLVITLGAIAIFVKSKIPGVLLILISITYALLGNIINRKFVESIADFPLQIISVISILLGLTGGTLIIIGANSKETPQVISETAQVVQDNKA